MDTWKGPIYRYEKKPASFQQNWSAAAKENNVPGQTTQSLWRTDLIPFSCMKREYKSSDLATKVTALK